MKSFFCSLIISLNLFATIQAAPLKLWYKNPARVWVEALPLGNGHIGAMMFGNPVHEEYQLNEETVWSGSPHNNVNYNAKDSLDKIRQLIFADKNLEAQNIAGKAICSQGAHGMPYQTVGSLKLDFEGMDNYTQYYRELDLEKAMSTVRFEANGVEYTRESFTSFTDNMLVIRLSASKKNALSFNAKFTSPYPGAKRKMHDSRTLCLQGKGDDHEGIEGKVKFTSLARFENKGGNVNALSDSVLQIKNASSVTIYVTIGTNFVNYKDLTANDRTRAIAALKTRKAFDIAKKRHIAFYSKKFGKVSLSLGHSAQELKPTDVRLKEFKEKDDPGLIAMYFQFGRYLLLSSSQKDCQPANLQGIWNEKRYAPWDGKYANDINVQMNYWPAEVTNLSEEHTPLINLVKNLSYQGVESAKMYGCNGWTVHHVTDIWCVTGAADHPYYGVWPTASAWLCQHLWDRYLFSGDKTYLKEVYPVLKGACRFFFDFLVRDPRNNYLVATPSYSPENSPIFNGKHSKASLVAGATIDNQMMHELFSSTKQAAITLNDKANFIDSLQYCIENLPPMQIGKWGQLQEWFEDWDDPKDQHRHLSHLWGLYPGRQINAFDTPHLFEAAQKSLTNRGSHSTGWSMGWKVCLWARLLNGEMAGKLITEQLTPTMAQKGTHGGTYPNMFDAHPPFQIDGNFGCTAGIAEMMVQSHTNAIHLLPAIPSTWDNGEVKGLRCRGGFTIENMQWKDNTLYEVSISSKNGGVLRIRSDRPLTYNGTELQDNQAINPLLQSISVKDPLVHNQNESTKKTQKEYYTYSIVTKPGAIYTFKKK